MNKFYLLYLLLLFVFPVKSQLNCQTFKIFSGDSSICLHQNGVISTISFPSRQHEWYSHFMAFDVNGNKVLETGYGLLHGSASLDITYHSNGAIRSARRTFQPDGGIQHYDATTFYHEDGTFSHEEDNSWDRQLTQPFIEPINPVVKLEQKSIQADSLSFHIKNTTNRKVKLLVGYTGMSVNKEIITIKKNASIEIGKYLPTKNDRDPTHYFELDILPSKKSYQPKLVWSNDFIIERNCHLLIVLFKE